MPLAVATILVVVMLTWRRGTGLLAAKAYREEVPLLEFIEMLENRAPQRVKGMAVFLTGSPNNVPSALLHNLKHNKVLHERNVILSILTEDTPRVEEPDRASVERLSDGFLRLTLRFGFMEIPHILKALPALRAQGWNFDLTGTSFFVSRRALRPSTRSRMPWWQDKLFISLARSATDVSQHFGIPTSRAIELGSQVTV
jgi:KUP system potassium uptake protein